MVGTVTFGVPVYNGEDYLASSLRSLQDQVDVDVRIIVSDNGSTDTTEELCRSAARDDDRIEYHRYDENRGGIWNYQHVLDLAGEDHGRGPSDYFSWMPADDIKLPRFAAACVEALDEAGPDHVFACPRTEIIDSAGVVTEQLNDLHMGLDASSPRTRVSRFLQAQASHLMYGVLRYDAVARTRGIRSLLGDDMIIVTELLCQGRFALVPEVLFQQRRHDAQVSVNGAAATSWFAPGTRPHRAFAQSRTNIGLYGAVRHSRLDLPETLACWSAVTTRWVLPRWRAVARDVADAVGVNPQVGRLRARRAEQVVQG